MQASEVLSQVVTKNDDAPVQVTDWDVWKVDIYQHPDTLTVRAGEKGRTGFQLENPSKVFVCKPGTYSPDTHGALRALRLCRACRNALQGLLAFYLQKQYGTKEVHESVEYTGKEVRKNPCGRKKRKRTRGKGAMANI